MKTGTADDLLGWTEGRVLFCIWFRLEAAPSFDAQCCQHSGMGIVDLSPHGLVGLAGNIKKAGN